MLGSLDGGRGKVEQLVDNVIAASSITLQERRPAAELDAYVPMILRDGALYDPDLDRFFRELPLHGVRSRHSLRAYGYDVLVWVRFLSEACAKTVWQADNSVEARDGTIPGSGGDALPGFGATPSTVISDNIAPQLQVHDRNIEIIKYSCWARCPYQSRGIDGL